MRRGVSRRSPATGRFASGSALRREPVLRPLPIYRGPLCCPLAPSGQFVAAERNPRSAQTAEPRIPRPVLLERWGGPPARNVSLPATAREERGEIGRASCRERV